MWLQNLIWYVQCYWIPFILGFAFGVTVMLIVLNGVDQIEVFRGERD